MSSKELTTCRKTLLSPHCPKSQIVHYFLLCLSMSYPILHLLSTNTFSGRPYIFFFLLHLEVILREEDMGEGHAADLSY